MASKADVVMGISSTDSAAVPSMLEADVVASVLEPEVVELVVVSVLSSELFSVVATERYVTIVLLASAVVDVLVVMLS